MQNWQHIEEIIQVMNKIPPHKAVINDINEIREHFFENLSKFYRQNIVYTDFRFPQLNALISSLFENHDGIIWNKQFYGKLISDEELPINQEFIKFDVTQHLQEPKIRFEYFINKVKLSILDC